MQVWPDYNSRAISYLKFSPLCEACSLKKGCLLLKMDRIAPNPEIVSNFSYSGLLTINLTAGINDMKYKASNTWRELESISLPLPLPLDNQFLKLWSSTPHKPIILTNSLRGRATIYDNALFLLVYYWRRRLRIIENANIAIMLSLIKAIKAAVIKVVNFIEFDFGWIKGLIPVD